MRAARRAWEGVWGGGGGGVSVMEKQEAGVACALTGEKERTTPDIAPRHT